MSASRGFVDWLISQNVSLAFSTYQTGKLFLIGHNVQGQFSVFERTFERAMGLAGGEFGPSSGASGGGTSGGQSSGGGGGQSIFMATLYQIWRIENVLAEGESIEGYDRLFVPQVGQTTGDLNVHDVALVSGDHHELQPIFISARFSCLAATSNRYHFTPLWMPPFISRLAAEDRCHLNGLAMRDGRPRYVTACSQTDIVDGWREHRRDGGVVIDIECDEVIAQGLSMPHSPRWYRDKLWLLDSGSGYFGFLDPSTGKFERVTFCPGFARGLAFVGDFAVVGLSLPRHDPTFTGLELQEHLDTANVSARCGLLVINLTSGDIVEWLRLEEPVRELYDVLALPGVQRPRLVGFKTDEIRTRVWAEPQALRRIEANRKSNA